VVGTIAGDLQGFLLHRTDGSSLRHALGQKSLYFVYLAIGQFILIYVATVGFVFAGEVIASRVRALYLKAVLRQNTAFFDNLGTGEILVHLTADVNHIQDGISEKVAVTLTALATFNSAFVICFVKYWKLTIICLSTVVAIFTTVNLGALFLVKFKKRSFEAYAVGGSVVEESLTSMTNATAFGIQDRLARLYYKHLLAAEELGLKFKHTLAVMIGFIVCFNFLNYGLVLWMGSRFLVDGDVLLSQILTIILAITIATFSLGQIGPNFESFTAAIAAASKIYAHIDRKSPLDPLSVEGGSLPEVHGNITLKDIKLIYPSRSDVVLEGFDLTIPARQTTALVGASGSGKSSIISLIERFYNPVGGEVRLDDHPISTLNLSWLRQQMSLVQQKPVLFDDTIFHNIKIGLLGSQVRHESEEQETNRIIEAAKTANAHNFIMALPEGYQTRVGSSSLSGGEKQRVAIARAIVKNPKILLLDEPTSALDADSERVVQAALERAAENRTTLIIAHRLSTIRAADNIVVMHQGQIVEQGTHLTLMENRDLYFDLFAAQRDGYLKAESVARSDVTTLGGRPRTSTLGTPTSK
jgi:ATP-binding cassette, subfamily B (MDR/TAP), member 1